MLHVRSEDFNLMESGSGVVFWIILNVLDLPSVMLRYELVRNNVEDGKACIEESYESVEDQVCLKMI